MRAFKSVGGTPITIRRGRGPRVWDADGTRYVDYLSSWGPAILGHADPQPHTHAHPLAHAHSDANADGNQ